METMKSARREYRREKQSASFRKWARSFYAYADVTGKLARVVSR